MLKFCAFDVVCWYSKSFEEFWTEWESDYWKKQRESGYMVAVGLWGFASPKQIVCTRKSADADCPEFQGQLLPQKVHDKIDACLTPNVIRENYRNRYTRLARTAVTGGTIDSLYDTLRAPRSITSSSTAIRPPWATRVLTLNSGRSILASCGDGD